MKLKFLGTGAADWTAPDARGEYRRFTSTLINAGVLIDVTLKALDLLGETGAVTDVFFTHSHRDHFDIEALKRIAPCRVWAHESWAGEIEAEGLDVRPLAVGQSVSTEGLTFTPLPSNHSTERKYETTLHYLIEDGQKRLLFATDGAWILNAAHHIIGKKELDAIVFDATIGDAHPADWRVFEHNSLEMVRLMTGSMLASGRLKPSAPVFLTHLARTLHPSQAELERSLTPPYIACFDGFETQI